MRGIKTPELRKRLRPAIVALFSPAAVEVGNQSDSYMSQFGGSRVTVGLSLGSQHFQLGYQIDIESADPPGRLFGTQRSCPIGCRRNAFSP